MRIILYTGKGGVGKTSVAAATAVRAAEMGYRTVVVSTDMAHSLGDSFDVPLGPDPVLVADRLWGQEIDVLKEMEAYWATVRDWLVALMRWQGADEVVAEEVAVLPGMDELVGLLYLNRYHDSNDYDLLVVDCAPTGETLRLLSFPETMRWYMHRIFPIEKRVVGALAPLARGLLRVPVPTQKVFDSIEFLFGQLEQMSSILADEETSSVRLVVNAEKMVIKEAQRTFTYLNLYGYSTDLVVCNRIIPDEVEDAYFQAWKEAQGRYLGMIKDGFSPVPVLQAPLMVREVVGLEALRQMAEAIFADQDPTQVFYKGRSYRIVQENRHKVLKVTLPFIGDQMPSVIQNGDELTIQAAHQRRTIVLPRALVGRSVQRATMEDGTLSLVFGQERETQLSQ